MTALEILQAAVNERYLGAALAWLRARFDQLTEAPTATAGSAGDPATRAARDAEAAARTEMDRWSGEGAALPSLARGTGLGQFERDVLLLCVAMELDPATGERCALLQGPALAYPTFALAASLFEDATWEAISTCGRLTRWRLVEVRQDGGALITSRLRADDTVVDHVKGLRHVDPRLEPLLLPPPPADVADLPASLRAAADRIADAWRGIPEVEPLPVVQLAGPAASGKDLVASRIGAEAGLGIVRFSASRLAAVPDVDEAAALWRRDSVLLGSCALVDADADDVAVGGSTAALSRFLAAGAGPVFVATREPLTVPGRPDVVVDVEWPTPTEQRALWAAALPAGCEGMADELSASFRLDPVRIRSVARRAGGLGFGAPLRSWLWRECHAATRPRLDALANWTRPLATWADLVLPDAETELLRLIPSHVRYRTLVHEDWGFGRQPSGALGTPVLFAGPSGTGKTLAAEVIAADLDAPLCRVDLSGAVSKYIGETEKNLARLFDAAEESAAVLFFDEADALFGKRSVVRDSHDRYANIETGYLLQRMDRFRGLVLLATNLPEALDQAFLRRIRFVVEFPLPARPERQRMWQHAFPPHVPLDPSLDLEPLVALPLTGAVIAGIALHAAFAAAAEGGGVLAARHLAVATEQELHKIGRRPPDRLWPEEVP